MRLQFLTASACCILVAVYVGISVFVSPLHVFAHAGEEHGSLSAIIEHVAIERDRARSGIGSRMDDVVVNIAVCEENRDIYADAISSSSLMLLEQLNKIDAVLNEAVDYYRSQNLSRPGIGTAYDDAAHGREAALIDVGVLGVLNHQIDCTSTEVLIDMVAFRDAVPTAQRSLMAYRDAVVRFLEVLRGDDVSIRVQENRGVGI